MTSDGTGYVVVELGEGEQGGFAPRGAVKELWSSRDFEVIVAGPAETGKTWGCLQYADALLWKFPGAQGVMCRKVYSSLVGSAVRTYQRILGPDSPVHAFGGEKPQWFDYPNGSRLWLAGMDNPGKALSSERDFIYCNQAEELALNDWETLTTRATGRGAVMPYTRVFGDANPGPPAHWIKGREDAGKLRLLESRHEDNPTLFDEAGNITEQGRKTLSILDSLTGARLLRLRHGKWVSAEGVVYETFDPAVHVIDPQKLPAMTRHIGSVDWGFTNPGTIQVWGFDGDGRMYLRREVYRSKRLIDWWVEQAKALKAAFGVDRFVCDPAEPAYIQAFRSAGLVAIPGNNDIEPGIQAVQARLKVAGDGRPRLMLVSDMLADRDELLVEAKQPVSLRQELDVYVWPKGVDGKTVKEVPVDAFNHGADAMRYAVMYKQIVRRPGEVILGGTSNLPR